MLSVLTHEETKAKQAKDEMIQSSPARALGDANRLRGLGATASAVIWYVLFFSLSPPPSPPPQSVCTFLDKEGVSRCESLTVIGPGRV